MVERKVIDREVLIKTLSEMRYKHISELQMTGMFNKFGYNIQIEEDDDVEEGAVDNGMELSE